jgi:hypothetical protein
VRWQRFSSFGFFLLAQRVGKKPNVLNVCWLFTMNANVLALGAVADFGAQNCQYTTKVDAR